MKKTYSYGEKPKKIIVILLAVLFFALFIVLGRINRGGFAMIDGQIPISGVLTAIQFGICFLMVSIEYELGGRLAFTLMGFSIIRTGLSIVIKGDFTVLPGFTYYVVGIICLYFIRKRIATERKNSLIDGLTGVSNRKHTLQYIDHLSELKKPFYVIFIELENLKMVNDIRGHERGDHLLKKLVKSWERTDKNAMIGRFGGDEFLSVITDAKCDDISGLAYKYIESVGNMLGADDTLYGYLTASVGISKYPDHGSKASELVRKANIAIHKVQENGRNGCLMYENSFEDNILRTQYIEGKIKEALENDEFSMVYQPQYYTKDKKLRGFEALIRVNPGKDGPIGPGEFIPIAEESDLIIDIGNFVIKKTTSDFAPIISRNPDLILSVNISAKQMLSKHFVDNLRKAVEDSEINPNQLEIEITEYCLMDTTDEAIKVINEIKNMGVQIAMDDFGTGYSSLSYLTSLPIDLIKIDKSIIDSIGDGEIVGAICSMGHAISCEIIAEGVEDEGQLEILETRGCDMIQGFIFGRPMPYEEVLRLVE